MEQENIDFPQTPEEMLREVNKAIYTILIGGQSYKLGSRSLTRADLNSLRQLKSEIQTQQCNETNAVENIDNTYVAIFGGR